MTLAALNCTALPPSARGALADALAASGLPHEDLGLPGRRFFRFADDAGRTLGFGGLELHGEDALLRSVVVPDAARGSGVGTAIVRRLLKEAAALGASRVFLLTTTAAGFFARLGFAETDRARVPPAIAATTEFASLCPSTATCMATRLPPGA